MLLRRNIINARDARYASRDVAKKKYV